METCYDELIKLEFAGICLPQECRPFPVVYMALDPEHLEVVCKIFLLDKQVRNGLSIERVKDAVERVLNISEWEQERDACLRGWELYGIINLTSNFYLEV